MQQEMLEAALVPPRTESHALLQSYHHHRNTNSPTLSCFQANWRWYHPTVSKHWRQTTAATINKKPKMFGKVGMPWEKIEKADWFPIIGNRDLHLTHCDLSSDQTNPVLSLSSHFTPFTDVNNNQLAEHGATLLAVWACLVCGIAIKAWWNRKLLRLRFENCYWELSNNCKLSRMLGGN